MRVVALLPAASEIVVALGAAELLCGVTHECDHPAFVTGLPRVTSTPIDSTESAARVDARVRALHQAGLPLFSLDAELLAKLRPTLLITQALCDVCALSENDVRAMAARLSPVPMIVTLGGSSLDGVFDDIRRVAEALDVPDEGEELLLGLRVRMRTVHETLRAAHAPRPRVAVLEWTDPVYTAGHWVPEMVRRAGGVDVASSPEAHSRHRSVDEIRKTAPDCLVIAPCGYDLGRATLAAATLLVDDAGRWARGLPVWAMDGNAYISRPGPRLVDGIEALARAFNGALFSPLTSGVVRVLHP